MSSKWLKCLLLMLLGLIFLLIGSEVRANNYFGYGGQAPVVSKTSLVINNYEFGPGVSKVVLELNRSLGSVDFNSDSKVTTAGVERTVTDAYLSDAQGNPINYSKSRYLSLVLEVGKDVASPFSFDLAAYRNRWVGSYNVKVENIKVSAFGQDQTINSEQEAINNLILPDAERFSERGTSGLSYAAYRPQGEGGKRPLIVWLHGIGEAGTDINFPLLANNVANLTKDQIQSYFTATGNSGLTGAYVLVPQAPTYWGGESNEAALMSTIQSYVSSHPDIDANRIYLVGASNGGGMVVDMGKRYPNYFAALVPISANYSYQATWAGNDYTYTIDDATYNALKNQPMWFIHSRSDQAIPVDNSVLPFYKAMIDRGASNKWLSYYETVVGTDMPGVEYDGHWSWVYLFNDQVRGVQSTANTASYSGLLGMVATNPTQGGASKATVNGVEYDDIFQWMNSQSK